jgi:effector-binding domain-containing protein
MQIGDFSKLSLVSVKALRYYDEIGLLKPERVDEYTGYRYYSASQLPQLNRIVAMKNLGLSLDEIAKLMRDDVSVEHILGLLHSKQEEIKKRLGEEAERLARVEEWLEGAQKEGKLPDYEVTIKKIKPVKVVSIRKILSAYQIQGELFSAIGAFIGRTHAPCSGPPVTIYYDKEFKETDVDVEVAFPVWRQVKTEGELKCYELPGYDKAATVVYKGPYDGIGKAYNSLLRWIESNGYNVAGPNRETYHNDPEKTKPEDLVTEIQVPVEKNS